MYVTMRSVFVFFVLWVYLAPTYAQKTTPVVPPIGGWLGTTKIEARQSPSLFSKRYDLRFLLKEQTHFYDAAMGFTSDQTTYSLAELLTTDNRWGMTLFEYFLLSGNINTVRQYLSKFPELRQKLSQSVSHNFNFLSNFFNRNQLIREGETYSQVDLYLTALIEEVDPSQWFNSSKQSNLAIGYLQKNPLTYVSAPRDNAKFPHQSRAQQEATSMLHSVTFTALEWHLEKLLDSALSFVKQRNLSKESEASFYYAYIYQSIAMCDAPLMQKVSSTETQKYWYLQTSHIGNFVHLAALHCYTKEVFDQLVTIDADLFSATNQDGLTPSFFLFERKTHAQWDERSVIEILNIFIDQTDQNPLAAQDYDTMLLGRIPNAWKWHQFAIGDPKKSKSINNILLHYNINLNDTLSVTHQRTLYQFIINTLLVQKEIENCWLLEEMLEDLLYIKRYTNIPINIKNGTNQNILHDIFNGAYCDAQHYSDITFLTPNPYAYEDLIQKYYGWFFQNAGFEPSDLTTKDNDGNTPLDYLESNYSSREVGVMKNILKLNGLL